MAKFEAFVAYNEAMHMTVFTKTFFGITWKPFQTSKHHEEIITFLRRNDYCFKKKYRYQF